jgi:hypothetical protein
MKHFLKDSDVASDTYYCISPGYPRTADENHELAVPEGDLDALRRKIVDLYGKGFIPNLRFGKGAVKEILHYARLYEDPVRIHPDRSIEVIYHKRPDMSEIYMGLSDKERLQVYRPLIWNFVDFSSLRKEALKGKAGTVIVR